MTFAIDMELGATPEAVGLIRRVVEDAARTLGFDDRLTDDLKTAVSEAATNAVTHPYGPEGGPMTFSMKLSENELELRVADAGDGLARETETSGRGLGLGLMVISTLADRAEFASRPSGGTEVRMSFRLQKLGRRWRGGGVAGQLPDDAASPPRHRLMRTSTRSTGSPPSGRRKQSTHGHGPDRHSVDQARRYLTHLRQERPR